MAVNLSYVIFGRYGGKFITVKMTNLRLNSSLYNWNLFQILLLSVLGCSVGKVINQRGDDSLEVTVKPRDETPKPVYVEPRNLIINETIEIIPNINPSNVV
jgi:hypothetical protein